MGRAKVRMELIKSEKARQATLKSRKSGLKKKIKELSTLCDVKACMIMYEPEKNDRPVEPEIWPTDPNEIQELFHKYKTQPDDDRVKRTADLVSFFKDRKEKLETTLMKERKKNIEAQYPTWDKRFDDLSEGQLREFALFLETKIGSARPRLEVLKTYKRLESSGSKVYLNCHSTEFMQTSLRTTKSEFDWPFRPQPRYEVSSQDIIDQTRELEATPLNANYSNPLMMTMLMNSDNYGELDGMHSNNFMFTPLNGPMYSDPLLGTLDYTVVNNPSVGLDCNYGQTVQQQSMPQYAAQYPIMRGLPQMHETQTDGYYEDNFQMKNHY